MGKAQWLKAQRPFLRSQCLNQIRGIGGPDRYVRPWRDVDFAVQLLLLCGRQVEGRD